MAEKAIKRIMNIYRDPSKSKNRRKEEKKGKKKGKRKK